MNTRRNFLAMSLKASALVGGATFFSGNLFTALSATTATKTFTFRLNTYNEDGSAISTNYKMYMTLNEEAPGTSGPGPSITQSQTLENLQSNHSYDNTYTLTFQKPTTIFSEMEFVLYVTIE